MFRGDYMCDTCGTINFILKKETLKQSRIVGWLVFSFFNDDGIFIDELNLFGTKMQCVLRLNLFLMNNLGEKFKLLNNFIFLLFNLQYIY